MSKPSTVRYAPTLLVYIARRHRETIRDDLRVCVEQTRMGVAGMPHARRHLTPDQYPLPYLRMVRNYISGDGLNLSPQSMVERIVRILTDDEALRKKEFWAFLPSKGWAMSSP